MNGGMMHRHGAAVCRTREDICGRIIQGIGENGTCCAAVDGFGTSAAALRLALEELQGLQRGPFYRAAKRGMDIAVSLAALALLWPLMVGIAVVVRALDGGPALYRQRRLTLNGREFTILKFRSMRLDAEADGIPRLAAEHDARITPVGRVLRAYRLDELPQLLNVLRGDMSIVGPRPERPELAAVYERSIPAFRLRLLAKAGLTGYAQVHGGYDAEPREKLRMDLIYISRPSILEDMRIMAETLPVLLAGEGTRGVKAQDAAGNYGRAHEA